MIFLLPIAVMIAVAVVQEVSKEQPKSSGDGTSNTKTPIKLGPVVGKALMTHGPALVTHAVDDLVGTPVFGALEIALEVGEKLGVVKLDAESRKKK